MTACSHFITDFYHTHIIYNILYVINYIYMCVFGKGEFLGFVKLFYYCKHTQNIIRTNKRNSLCNYRLTTLKRRTVCLWVAPLQTIEITIKLVVFLCSGTTCIGQRLRPNVLTAKYISLAFFMPELLPSLLLSCSHTQHPLTSPFSALNTQD